MAVFCVGQSAWDITLPYTGPLQVNQKYRVTRAYGCPGAPALNGACLCAMWGADVELMTRIGSDPYGALLRAELERLGVGRKHLIRDQDATTSYSLIAVDDATAERTIFNVPCASHAIDCPLPKEAPDAILSDGHEPEATLALIEAFPDAPSVVDAGTYRASTYEVACCVDYLVCSEDFARQYTGAGLEDADDMTAVDALLTHIARINDGVAVVTLGERGLVYRDEVGAPCHMPAFPAQAVDTTGAGDIFHGAFAHGLYAGLSLEENLKRASMASSLSVCSMGGFSSIPSLALVLEELERAEA